MTPRPLRELTALEARALGVLIEKERTVPDAYPMTLNALAAGCNQKTSRNPVMVATELQIVAALEALKALSMVIESSGGRVMRYAQNFKRVVQVPSESVALLATLILRGPQTAAELRTNSERLCRFSDLSAVEAFLQELAARATGALVVESPRQAGSRENRWMHLLCGDAGRSAASTASGAKSTMQVDLPEVRAEVAALLARHESALVDNDVEALDGLLWSAPRNASQSDRDTVSQTTVTTFGRDCAVTSVAVSREGASGVECRRQTWIRLPEGWRIVDQR